MGSFTSAGTENQMQWDRRSRGFMEVWYATLNHTLSGMGVWLRYTLTAPASGRGEPFCELWGFLFDPEQKLNFAGKQRWPIEHLAPPDGRDDGALIRIGDAWLSENHLQGAIETSDRRLAWSLDFKPSDRTFQHLPDRVRRRAERRVSTVCSPNLTTAFSGEIEIDGQRIPFHDEPGCQSHRWGKKHSTSWAWAHCSVWDSPTSALFEGVAARAPLGPFTAPTTTFLYLQYEGEDINFNELRWALRARSRYELPTWAFSAHTEEWRIAGAARARPDRMYQVMYEDPDGERRYCANSEIADLGIEIYRRSESRWRHAASLTALRTAHVEFGRPEPFEELPVSL